MVPTMSRTLFLSLSRESVCSGIGIRVPSYNFPSLINKVAIALGESHRSIPWIESPLNETVGDAPHLYRRSDATSIELFFDLFLVANLSTFTATHEINNLPGLGLSNLTASRKTSI